MVLLPVNGRRSTRFVSAIAICCAFAAPGCNDSVAPSPSGQMDAGGGAGGGFPAGGMASDVPRAPSSARSGSSGGTVRPSAAHTPAGHGATASRSGTASGVGPDFYAAAAEAAPKGPAGPPVTADERAAEAVEKASAGYPPLATFAAAEQAVPEPDPAAAYQPIVDPAEGTLPTRDDPIELASKGVEIDAVRFSSPSAGQVVLLTRVTEAGKPDKSRLVRYDLASGERPSAADLPDRAVLLDVSPDGTRALVRLTFGLTPEDRPAASQTRLDVWELNEAEGRHIVGWQPGAKGDGARAVPVGGAFLDGDRVVTLTDDGVLSLWNLAESKAAYTVETGARGPLVVTPGRKFVALFTGTTFGAFEAATGAFRGLLTPPRPTLAGCREAAFSPDGAELAAVLRRPAQSVVAWDVKTGRPAHEVDATLGLGPGLHFGSPGYVVAGGTLFDFTVKKPVWLYVENPTCRNVGVSPDRRHWAVTQPAFQEPSLQAVEAPTGEIASAARSAANLAAPRLGPGDALAVRLKLDDFTGDRAVFEAALGKTLARVLGERGLRFDPDADLTLAVDADERATGETISFSSVGIGSDEAVPAHEIGLTLAVVDKKENTLWADSGRVPATVFLARQEGKSLEAVLLEELWRSAPAVIASEIERSMPAYLRNVPADAVLGQTRLWAGADDVSLPGDAPLVANAGSADPADLIAAAPVRQPAATLTVASAGAVRDLLVAPSSGWLVTASDDKTVRLWDPLSLKRVDDLKHKSGVTKLAPHPNGSQFLFGTEDGQVRVFDVGRGAAAGSYEGANDVITDVAVTVEPTVVAGTQAGRVVRWTDADRAKPAVIADGQAAVTGVAVVPYLNRVVATWADGTAKLVDAGTGQVVLPLAVEAGPIHGVTISPDAQTAAFATETGGAVLVSLQTGLRTDALDAGAVTAVAYRPDGMQLATANRLGRVVIWDLPGNQPSSRLEGAGGEVSAMVFSANGLGLAAAVAGRRVVPIWNLGAPAQGGAGSPATGHSGPSGAHGGPRGLSRPSTRSAGPAAHGAHDQ